MNLVRGVYALIYLEILFTRGASVIKYWKTSTLEAYVISFAQTDRGGGGESEVSKTVMRVGCIHREKIITKAGRQT